MSIINDALKKTQDQLKNAKTAEGSAKPANQQPSGKKTLASIEEEQERQREEQAAQGKVTVTKKTKKDDSSQKNSSHTGLLIFILLSCAVMAAWIYYPSYKSKIKLPALKGDFSKMIPKKLQSPAALSNIGPKKELPSLVSLSAQTPSPATNKESAAANPQQEIPNISVQGIITQNNKKAALINNFVYEEGQNILDWKIVTIEETQVTLENTATGKKTIINVGIKP